MKEVGRGAWTQLTKWLPALDTMAPIEADASSNRWMLWSVLDVFPSFKASPAVEMWSKMTQLSEGNNERNTTY